MAAVEFDKLMSKDLSVALRLVGREAGTETTTPLLEHHENRAKQINTNTHTRSCEAH